MNLDGRSEFSYNQDYRTTELRDKAKMKIKEKSFKDFGHSIIKIIFVIQGEWKTWTKERQIKHLQLYWKEGVGE